MSEFVIDDWKLNARTVVKLYRKNTNTLVSLSVKDDIVNCLNVSYDAMLPYDRMAAAMIPGSHSYITRGHDLRLYKSSENYIFRENSLKVDEHFSLFFVKISRKLRSHFLVIFRENMVHNKASLHNVYGEENL